MIKPIFPCIGLVSLAVLSSVGQASTPAMIEPAALTNAYLTINDFEEDALVLGKARIEPNRLTAALRSNQSKPAEEDLEGNWGRPSAGLLLSVRFEKIEFRSRESISATILLRNVSDQDKVFDATQPDWDFRFAIRNEDGNLLQDREPTPRGDAQRFISPRALPIYVRTQRRFIVPLSSHFILEAAGKYSISVMARVRQPNGSEPLEVVSATAHIQVTPAEPGTQTNPPIRTPK
jgi:hypothetical protein